MNTTTSENERSVERAAEKAGRARDRFGAELDQAWAHHRHLADKGLKFMDRFMALTVGAAAFCAAIIDKKIDATTLPVFAVALFVVSLLCLSVARSITANRFALEAYDWFFERAMNHYYAGQVEVPNLWDLRKDRPAPGRLWVFYSGDFDVLILYALMLMFPAAQLLIGVECLARSEQQEVRFSLLPFAFALMSLGLTLFAFIRWTRAKGAQNDRRIAEKTEQ